MSGYVVSSDLEEPRMALPVSERITRLEEKLFSIDNVVSSNSENPRGVCFERARIVTESYKGTEGEHSALRRARALHDVFTKMDSRNGRYTCGVWPVNAHVGAGHWTAATPDGRHKGEPLVDGVGACQGADRNGPTALLRSVARLNNIEHWSAGNTCNIKFSRSSISSEEGVKRLQELTTTFMKLGGQELQINVVDAATLRAAKADPERHQDLIVRVAGYSAYFTQLGSDVQDEIITRTEHEV